MQDPFVMGSSTLQGVHLYTICWFFAVLEWVLCIKFSRAIFAWKKVKCNIYATLQKKWFLRILADLAIKAVMGHRLEPKSQVLPSFKLTLWEFPRVSNSHWLPSPITAIMASARFFGIIRWWLFVLLATGGRVIYTKVNLIGLQVFLGGVRCINQRN